MSFDEYEAALSDAEFLRWVKRAHPGLYRQLRELRRHYVKRKMKDQEERANPEAEWAGTAQYISWHRDKWKLQRQLTPATHPFCSMLVGHIRLGVEHLRSIKARTPLPDRTHP